MGKAKTEIRWFIEEEDMTMNACLPTALINGGRGAFERCSPGLMSLAYFA